MENQLVTLSIDLESLKNQDSSKENSISIHLKINSHEEIQKFPFIFQSILIQSEEIPILLEIYQNSEFLGRSSLKLSNLFCIKHEFLIFPSSSQESSLENQRHSEHKNEKSTLQSLGKGFLTITLSSESSEPIQSSLCHDIALNIQKLIRNPEETSLKELENLRVLIIGLNSKLKTLILLQQKVDSFQKFSEDCLNKREEAQSSVLKTCFSLECHNNQILTEFQEMNKKRAEVQKEINQLEVSFREKCVEENRLNGELKIKESEILNLQAQVKNFDEIEKFIKNLQIEKQNLEDERTKLRFDYKESIDNFSKEIFLKDEEILKRDEEISCLSSVIIEKNQEISRLSCQNDRKSSEILELQSSVEELNRVIISYKDLQKRCESFEEISKKHQAECISLHSTLSSNLASYKSAIFDLNLEKNSQLQTISALQSEISKLSTEVHEKLTLYRSEQIITQELRSKSAIIQQKLCNTLDVNKLFTQIKFLSTSMTELRDKLVEDNDELVRQVLQITEDFLNAGKVIQQVRDIIEDRDNEINILRDLIAELQNKTIYYPIKDDPVDEAIADYLNSRSEPLPVTFIREEYGLYLFGTKRVFIKLENNRIIIRVGGGFMRIDEFVNTYTAIELDKINERKNERNKPGRKALMGKVLDNIVGEKCAHKEVSNEAATRILQDAFSSSSGFSKCLVAPRRNSGVRLSRSKTYKD